MINSITLLTVNITFSSMYKMKIKLHNTITAYEQLVMDQIGGESLNIIISYVIHIGFMTVCSRYR